MRWSRLFDDPIPLAGGKPILSLKEAALYIQFLPPSELDQAHWQASAEALILVAERGGDTMLPRIGMMRAINRGRPERGV